MTQPSTDLATTSGALAVRPDQARWSDEQIAALRHIGAEKASPADLDVFFHQCARTGLDPFLKQIYLISYGGKPTMQVGIDGFRLVARRAAERAGDTIGYEDTQWCGPDGVWTDVWLQSDPPVAARAVVVRAGQRFAHVALFREFVGLRQARDGGYEPNDQWSKRGAHMIGKVAEAGALRKAFPADLSGVYAPEELAERRPGTVQGQVVQDSTPAAPPPLKAWLDRVAACTSRGDLRDVWADANNTPMTVTDRAVIKAACETTAAGLPDDTPVADEDGVIQ